MPAAGGHSPERKRSRSALLLLADGRFPAGGHAHSGGLEAAATLAGVRDLPALEAFLRGRAATAGAVSAAAAAASCAAFGDHERGGEGLVARIVAVDREVESRVPSPVLRDASRRLGRQLLRAGRSIWPEARLDALAAAMQGGLHQPVALGAVAGAAGLGEEDSAWVALHDAVVGPATAAVRLLGLDPFGVHALLALLGPELDAIACAAVTCSRVAPEDLPSWGAPLLDVLSELHATWEVRLFAS